MKNIILISIASIIGITGLTLGIQSFLSKPSSDEKRAKKLIKIGFSGVALLFISSLVFVFLYSNYINPPDVYKKIQKIKEELPDISVIEQNFDL